MAITTASFPELLWPGIKEIFGISYQDWPAIWPQFYTVENSTKAFEKVQSVTGIGLAGKKTEGAPIPYAKPYQGFQKEYVHDTYGVGAVVTQEMYEDEQYGYINKLPAMIGRSMRHTEETVATNVINRGFNAAYTGYDGKPLFSTSHLLERGGEWSNTPAASADLSQTSLETALMAIHDFVDGTGLKIFAQAKAILIPTSLEMTCKKILNSTQVSGSADNDINPINGSLKIIMSPYLTDDDSWYLITNVPNGLTWMWRRHTKATRDSEHDTQILKFAATARYTCGWTDPRGIYGVSGS